MGNILLPSSSTIKEKAIEQTIARTDDIPAQIISDVWNPDTCPAELLPWLAWAMSVDEWDIIWPADIKRSVIKQSISVHQKKGTRGAVRRALDALGVNIELKEWFETDATPHTFEIEARGNETLSQQNEAIIDQEFFSTVRRVINDIKPARSHFQVQVGATFGIIGLKKAIAANTGAIVREHAAISPQEITRQATPTMNMACRIGTIARTRMENNIAYQDTP